MFTCLKLLLPILIIGLMLALPGSARAEIESKFATAGQADPSLGNFYYYNWNDMSSTRPPDQTAVAPNHLFARIVGKLDDRQDGLSCNPCQRSNIDQIYNSEEPKIRDLLSRNINKAGVWIVGHAANHYPYLDPVDYAYQFDRYRDLIKLLDPNAKIANSGLLYLGYQLHDTSPNLFPYRAASYLNVVLSNLRGAYPDIYNFHIYPSTANPVDYSNNVQQARDFKNYLISKGEGSKPIWLGEFGMNYSGANTQQVISYMDTIIPVLKNERLADKWFWFIGSFYGGWANTSLTRDGAPTALGSHYLNLTKLPGNFSMNTPALRCSSSAPSIDLSWTPSANANVYSIIRYTSATDYTDIGSTTSTTFTDSNITSANYYFYKVVALNAFPTRTFSSNDSGWLQAPTCQGPTVDLKVNNSDGPVTINSGSSINLSWTSTNAVSCIAAGSTDWSGAKAISGSLGLAPITGPITKTYSLTCTNSSAIDTIDSVTVSVNGPLPGTFSIISTSTPPTCSGTSTYIDVVWSVSANADGYKITRTSDGNNWVGISQTTATSFRDSSVSPSTSYFYGIQAFNAHASIYPINQSDPMFWVTTPQCQVPLQASCSVAPTTVNIGQNVTWSALASGGVGSYTYAWSGTDSLTGTSQAAIKSYSTAGNKTGSVTITSGSQTQTAVCSNSVTVNPVPTPCTITSASWSGSNPIAEGNNVSLNVSATGNCTGKQVAFDIRQDTGLVQSIIGAIVSFFTQTAALTITNPSPVTLVNNSATASWRAQYNTTTGASNRYYFKTNIVGETAQVQSADPKLQVTQASVPPTGSRNYLLSSTPLQAVADAQNFSYQIAPPGYSFEDLAQDVDVVAVFAEFYGIPWTEFAGPNPPDANHPWTKIMTNFADKSKATGKEISLQMVLSRKTLPGKAIDNLGALKVDEWLPSYDCFNFARHAEGSTLKTAYLNYVKWMTAQFNPKYVNVAVEINDFYGKCKGVISEDDHAAAWNALVDVEIAAYGAAKSIKPSAIVFPSIQLETLYNEGEARSLTAWDPVAVDALKNLKGDRFAISTYPYGFWIPATASAAGYYNTPANIPADYFTKAAGGKSVIIAETGWNLESLDACTLIIPSTNQQQEEYLNRILTEAQSKNMELLTWVSNRDILPTGVMPVCQKTADLCGTDRWCRYINNFRTIFRNPTTGDTTMGDIIFKTFGTMGIRYYDGNKKPIFTTWELAKSLPLASPTPTLTPGPLEFGFNTHLTAAGWAHYINMNLANFKANIDELAVKNQKWVRFNIISSEVAPSGTATTINWDTANLNTYDQAIDYAKSKELKIYLVTSAVEFAKDFPASDFQTVVTNYHQFLANRYKGKIDIWQVFNEADTHDFRTYSDISSLTTDYLTSLKTNFDAAKAAIKAADTNIKVTTNVSGFPVHNDSATYDNWLTFYGNPGSGGLADSMDLISLDMYGDSYTPTFGFDIFRKRVDDTFTKYGKQVVVAETGICSDRINDAYFNETKQASDLPQYINAIKSSKASILLLYQLQDEQGSALGDSAYRCERSFGIKKVDGTLKPAYDPVMSAMTNLISPPCTITTVSWSGSNPLSEGNNVNLNVSATGNCTGKQAHFEVAKDSSIVSQVIQAVGAIFGLSLTINQPPDSPFNQTELGWQATGSWRAQYDNTVGASNRYYFKTNIVGETAQVQSADPKLQVTQIVVIPPTAPSIATPSCMPTPISNTADLTITWTNPAAPVTWVDISGDATFGTYYHKAVSGISTTAPIGFNESTGGGGLTIQPATTYYVRLFNGVNGPAATFNIPQCPPLQTSCSVTPTTVNIGQDVTWSAIASGGVGNYTYVWSGTDSLTGTSQTAIKAYSTAGNKTGSVRVTSGSQNSTVNCTNSVTVNPPTFDYNLTSSGDITVIQGQSGSNTVTATLSTSTTQPVTFTASGLPTGATASFSQTTCNPTCTSNLTINTTASTPFGNSSITVNASPLNKQVIFTLHVTPPPVIVSRVSATNIGVTSATFNWVSNIPTFGQVKYGLTATNLNQTFPATTTGQTPTISPSIQVTGLTPNKLYYYQVVSTAPAGNSASSPVRLLKTARR